MPEYIVDEEVRFDDTVFFGLLTARQGGYAMSVLCFTMIILFGCNPVIFVPLGLLIFVCVYFDFPEIIYELLDGILLAFVMYGTSEATFNRLGKSSSGTAKKVMCYAYYNDETCDYDRQSLESQLLFTSNLSIFMMNSLKNAKKASDYEKMRGIQELPNVNILYLQ